MRSYKDYGKLSGRSIDDMIAGARVEVAPFKEDPMDFVLWKPSDTDQPGWDSPWGRGRPGWHIECSAMADELLGDHFDIHGGGLDLQFPHHENELAQSTCAHPHGGFANVWMHNEMLQVEGKKMSKSLGNFFTVRDLLDQGIRGDEIRHVFFSTHYSKPMDWTAEKAAHAKEELYWWREATAEAKEGPPPISIISALVEDLNTFSALTEMRSLFKSGKYEDLRAAMRLLGFGLILSSPATSVSVSSAQALIADVRAAAVVSRDFSALDALKLTLIAAGIEVRMTKNQVELVPGPNFDASKLEALK